MVVHAYVSAAWEVPWFDPETTSLFAIETESLKHGHVTYHVDDEQPPRAAAADASSSTQLVMGLGLEGWAAEMPQSYPKHREITAGFGRLTLLG